MHVNKVCHNTICVLSQTLGYESIFTTEGYESGQKHKGSCLVTKHRYESGHRYKVNSLGTNTKL